MLNLSYLTSDEYLELGGVNYPDLSSYIKRANIDIFRLIGLENDDFNSLTEKRQNYVKLAVFDQTLYLQAQGIQGSVTSGQADTVSIGKYSEGTASAAGVNKHTGYADTVINWLEQAGLISRFGKVGRSGWYGDL